MVVADALCEVISCGSNAGKSHGGFLILKSLMGGEDFWRRQGFEHFACSSSVSWWDDCSFEVRKAFLQFKKQSSLRTLKKLPGTDPQQPPGPGHGLKSEELRRQLDDFD